MIAAASHMTRLTGDRFGWACRSGVSAAVMTITGTIITTSERGRCGAG